MSHFLALRQAVFVKAAEKLGNLSPLAILSRGYSITFREDTGGILKDAGEVRPGQRLRTRVHRGAIVSEVKEVESHGGDEV
jgi:exodeoxyribonuclease VII large subunit